VPSYSVVLRYSITHQCHHSPPPPPGGGVWSEGNYPTAGRSISSLSEGAGSWRTHHWECPWQGMLLILKV